MSSKESEFLVRVPHREDVSVENSKPASKFGLRKVHKFLSVVLLSAAALFLIGTYQPHLNGVSSQSCWWPFPWPHCPEPDEPKNGEIRWNQTCGDRTDSPLFECGTLYAPLDYTSQNDTRQARISVIRYKAGGGKTKREDVLGSVLLNPGGPGGSGFDLLGNTRVANLFDHYMDGRYDLVSFDPRGVGSTYPMVQCFNDTDKFNYMGYVESAYGLPGQHGAKVMKHEIGYMLADLHLLGSVCKEHPDSELFKYVSTAFVARDMNLLHKALGDEKINYWGFSYGTVLGSTYAAMFPNSINRMAIDGVVDVYNYYEGHWSNNLVDTEAEFEHFFRECTKAGSDNCKLVSLASEDKDLKTVVMDWANKLKINPVVVEDASPPRLLTYGDVSSRLLTAMYNPRGWPLLADNLYEAIHKGNSSALLYKINLRPTINGESEALYAIACSDAAGEAPGPGRRWGIEDFEKFWKLSYEDSPNFSVYFAGNGAMCHSGWQFRGAERYSGDFNTNTSFPLLLLGNDFDPVTPGRYADKMSKGFAGSVSVRRAGYGHCSISQSSKCIDDIVTKYFVYGELPAPGTYCEVDSGPFDKQVETEFSIAEFLIGPHFRV